MVWKMIFEFLFAGEIEKENAFEFVSEDKALA